MGSIAEADKNTESNEFDIRVTDLREEDLDSQPFGVIRLDRDATVLSFNKYEQKLSRRTKAETVGRNFFADVAPCTRVKEFYGRFLDGVARRELNATFGFVFDFAHGVRHVDISLFYKQHDDSIWVIVRGRPGSA